MPSCSLICESRPGSDYTSCTAWTYCRHLLTIQLTRGPVLYSVTAVLAWTLEINHFFLSMFGNTLAFSKLPLREIISTQKDIVSSFFAIAQDMFKYACNVHAEQQYKWHKNLQVQCLFMPCLAWPCSCPIISMTSFRLYMFLFVSIWCLSYAPVYIYDASPSGRMFGLVCTIARQSAESHLSMLKHHTDRVISIITRIETEHLDYDTQMRRLQDVASRFQPLMSRVGNRWVCRLLP
jgi:hypothetical protein